MNQVVSQIGGYGQFSLDGKRWIWPGVTDFSLHCRMIGETLGFEQQGYVRSLIRERKEVSKGRDVVHRVLGMMYWIRLNSGYAPHHPRLYGQLYYDTLARLADTLAEEGSRLEFCCLADCQQLGIGDPEQHEVVGRIAEVLKGRPNVFLSLGNEYPQNGFDPRRFEKPSGLVSSRGSNLGDAAPPLDAWDYCEFHLRRDYPQMFKDAVAADIIALNQNQGRPVVQDEPIGFADNPIPGRRSNDPALGFNLGVLFALNAGGTFHSDCGIVSVPFSGQQKLCGEQFFRGLERGTR